MQFEITINWDAVKRRGVQAGTWAGEATKYPVLGIRNEEILTADLAGELHWMPMELFKYAP